MKKISTWALLGLVLGFAFATGSFIRYYIIYPDLDKALTDVVIGALVCAVAWLYNERLSMKKKHDEIVFELNDLQDILKEHKIIK